MKRKSKRSAKGKNQKSKIIEKILFFLFSFFFFLFSLSTARAADDPKWTDIDLPGSNFTSIEGFVLGVLGWLLGFSGLLAALAIIYSGILYMTSGADEAKTVTAKKNLIWAITGLIVIVLSYSIVSYINQIISASP